MRVSKLPLLAFALFVAGCERSAVNATDAITVKGTLQDASGAARAGATVKLHRGPPRVDGAVCPLLLGTPWKTATAAADGTYSFAFTGKDSQTGDLLGNSEGGDLARCFRLECEGPNDSSVAADFTVQVVNIDAPLLRDYDAALAVSGATGSADFTWSAPAAGSKPTSYDFALVTDSGDALWSASTSGATTSASVADHLFEGAAAKAQITARAEEKASGTIWPTSAQSATLTVAARGAPPLSRGAACDVATPCPLTDGSFKAVSMDKDAVVVTFGAPLAVKHVVVRGLAGTGDRLVVDSSIDGTTFTSLSDVAYHSGHFDLEATSALAGVKALRLKLVKTGSSSTAAQISQLAEVSVFP